MRLSLAQHVQNHPRALVLVFQVRRVNQNLLVGLHRQIEVLQKHDRLVPRVLVEPDLADPQHARPIEKLGNHRDHFPRQRDVLRLLRVDAQPGVSAECRTTPPASARTR